MLNALENPIVFAERVLGITPHEKQCQFLIDDHPVRVLISGRRGGKSVALAIWASWQAVSHRARDEPFEAVIASPVMDQGRILLNYVSGLLRRSPVGGLVTREVAAPFPEIYLGDEVAIRVRASTDRGKHLRGRGADAILVDEAAFLRADVIQEAVTPILADHGGTLLLASTPNDLGGYLHGLFERGRDGADPRVCSFSFASTANPHISRAFVESQRAELTDAQWRTEWAGEFADPTARPYRWEDLLACVERESPELSGERTYVTGWDPAKIRDRSGVVVLDVTERPFRVVHIEDLAGQDYKTQIDDIARLARRRFPNMKVVVDATGGNGQVLVDLLRDAGVWTVGVVMSATVQGEMFAQLGVAFERRELRIPNDDRLLSELRWLRATRTATGMVRYEADRGKDDLVDALALALHGAGGVQKEADPLSLIIGSLEVDGSGIVHNGASAWSYGLGTAAGVAVLGDDGFPIGSWGAEW